LNGARSPKWPHGAKLAFIIRDDDISFFSALNMVETVHRTAMKRRFPISFSVIPEHHCSANPNTPPAMRTSDVRRQVGENAELVGFLKGLHDRGMAEMMQHGCAHTEVRTQYWRSEFDGLSSIETNARVARGREILRRAFGCSATTFVAPQEHLTSALLHTLQEEKFDSYCGGLVKAPRPYVFSLFLRGNAILHPVGRIREGGLRARPVHVLPSFRLYPESLKTYEAEGRDIVATAKEEILAARDRRSYFVLLIHSWAFFEDWGKLRDPMVDAYEQILEFVDSLREDVWKCRVFDVAKSVINSAAVA
jgi:hypothetical protein